MSEQWFLEKDGNRFGPFHAPQLKELAASGRLQATSLLWKAGLDSPVEAQRIKGLFVPDQRQNRPLPPPPSLPQSFTQTKRHKPGLAGRAFIQLSLGLGVIVAVAVFVRLLPLSGSNPLAHSASQRPPSSESENQTQPIARIPSDGHAEVHGPHGEKIMVGGGGLNTDWFFHYYLDKDGKKVMHGTSRVRSNGTGRQESNYDRGVLLSRSRYDSKQELTSSYKRLDNGTYQQDEYRTLSDGSKVQLRSVVTITETDSGETIKEVQKRQIVADDTPLPSVSGRRLKVNVDTAGIKNMSWWVKKHNASLSSVKCVATEDQVVIDFDIDASQWTPVRQTFPLLVRLFDKNGQYLAHFTTAEGFTVFVDVFDTFDGKYQRAMQARARDEAAKYKCVLLKPKGNRLSYGVNIRDLRDASIVEIGFTQR